MSGGHWGRGGMGSRKHGKSGKDKRPKSPRFLHWLKREIEASSVRRRPGAGRQRWVGSVAELFHGGER